MKDHPSKDEIEVSLFGPGYGESIVVHLGNSNWFIIDSCIHQTLSEPVPLNYLNEINANPKESVKIVIATHWHDDHIKGISRIVGACKKAEFCCTDVLSNKEFTTLVLAYKNSAYVENSGVTELGKVIECLSSRRELKTPRFAAENTVIWNRSGKKSGINIPVSITALSPSNAAKLMALESIGSFLPKDDSAISTKRKVSDPKPNSISMVLWVSIGNLSFLLGSDLENSSSEELGWKSILLNKNKPDGRAIYFKVPHHGSANAHNNEIWENMLEKSPVACLTPFNRSSILPDRDDIRRICELTDRAYSTSVLKPISHSVVRRTGAVNRSIKETVNFIRPVITSKGQIRMRIKPLKEKIPRIDLFDGALELKDTYSL